MVQRNRRAFATTVTPFTADGDVDVAALEALVDRLARVGIGMYVGGSGSGEGNTLTRDERRLVLNTAVRAAVGRVPVRAMGAEPRTVADMVEFVRDAAAAGVEAAQVYPLDMGHGKKPNDAELRRYLGEVVGSAEVPVVLVTHRAVGYVTPPPLLAELAAQHAHVVGVNCTHAELPVMMDLLRSLPPDRELHTGGPTQTLTTLGLGGSGSILTEANIAPEWCTGMVDAFEAGDLDRCGRAYWRILELGRIIDRYGGIGATKAAMNELGLPGGLPRDPRLPLSTEDARRMAAEIRALGLPDSHQL
jgi:4-hydroxy-tetrahydrodipicolinate synthase